MNMQPALLAFLQNLGMTEIIVIGIIALLLFGRRLPEVGRSLGKGIVEFKKGLRDIEDDVNSPTAAPKKPAASEANRPSSGGG